MREKHASHFYDEWRALLIYFIARCLPTNHRRTASASTREACVRYLFGTCGRKWRRFAGLFDCVSSDCPYYGAIALVN
jgi:hypothetical protein